MKGYEVLKMKEFETVKKYADRLMKVVNQLKLHDEELLGKRIVEKILVNVLKRFE